MNYCHIFDQNNMYVFTYYVNNYQKNKNCVGNASFSDNSTNFYGAFMFKGEFANT